MSQAFAKEGDAADDFPERPVSERPNYVTPAGLADLKKKRDELARRRENLPVEDRKLVERDLRYYDARLASAILIDRSRESANEVLFGAVVEVQEGAKRTRYTIVGEDEADPALGKLAWSSPLALALMGAKAGAEIAWDGEDGARTLKVLSVA